MAESIREKIIGNIITTIKSITVENGYGLTIRDARRVSFTPFNQAVFPIAEIQDLSEDKQDGVPMGHTTCQLHLSIAVWDKVLTGMSQNTNIYLADVEKALHADQTRGGYAYDTDVLGSQFFTTEDILPWGSIVIIVDVWYRHRYGDPYTQ